MKKTAQERWFASGMKRMHQRQEEELTKAWSKLILKGGAFLLGGIIVLKWLLS